MGGWGVSGASNPTQAGVSQTSGGGEIGLRMVENGPKMTSFPTGSLWADLTRLFEMVRGRARPVFASTLSALSFLFYATPIGNASPPSYQGKTR